MCLCLPISICGDVSFTVGACLCNYVLWAISLYAWMYIHMCTCVGSICMCVHVCPVASLFRSWAGIENWEELGSPHPSLTLVTNGGTKGRLYPRSRVSEGHIGEKFMGWPVRYILSQFPGFYHVLILPLTTTMATCLL